MYRFVFVVCVQALYLRSFPWHLYKLEMVSSSKSWNGVDDGDDQLCNCIKSQMWCKLHCLYASPGKYMDCILLFFWSWAMRKCGVIKSERTILQLYDLWEFAWWIYHWLLLRYGFGSKRGGNNFSSFCMKSRLNWMQFSLLKEKSSITVDVMLSMI